MHSTDLDVDLQAVPRANGFFVRPLVRSWTFIAVTVFSAIFVVADGVVLMKYWESLRTGMIVWLILLAYQVVIGGILRIRRAHARIREEFSTGKLDKRFIGSSADVVMDVAANSVLNAAIMDLILIFPYLWFIIYFVRHMS